MKYGVVTVKDLISIHALREEGDCWSSTVRCLTT